MNLGHLAHSFLADLAVRVVVLGSAALYSLAVLGTVLALRERRWARVSARAGLLAWVTHTVALVGGAVAGGKWAIWSSAPGAILLAAWLAASSYLVGDDLLREAAVNGPRRRDSGGGEAGSALGLYLFPAIALGLILADALVWWAVHGPVEGSDPAVLGEPWVPVHAVLAAVGWGLFTLAWVANLMYRAQDRSLRQLKGRAPSTRTASSGAVAPMTAAAASAPLSRLLPSLEALDRAGLRLVVAGFIFLAAGLIPGILRAMVLWGPFWFLDPKVVSTLLAALAYAFYLVARARLGWTANRAWWVLTVGFALTAANLLVATPFLSRFHQWL